MIDAGTLNLDEGASVRRAAAEPAAFDVVYDRYFSRVWNYVRYRVATPETADDLTSEIFEKALRKLGSYDPAKGVFSGWLFAIARNSVRDHYRSDKRWKSLFTLLSAAEPRSEPDPIDRIVEDDERRQVLTAIAGLSERERDVMGLKFGAQLTNRHIAALTGLSDSNVGVIVYRAVGRIRQKIKAENDAGR